jgi:threonine synthase
MDVGNPSNMERLRALYPALEALRAQVSADVVDDAGIQSRIRSDYARYGRVWCPHTATAAEIYSRLPAQERRERPWVLVATAHPAKFNEIVEPLIGTSIEVPSSLAHLLSLPQQLTDIAATLPSLAAAIE